MDNLWEDSYKKKVHESNNAVNVGLPLATAVTGALAFSDGKPNTARGAKQLATGGAIGAGVGLGLSEIIRRNNKKELEEINKRNEERFSNLYRAIDEQLDKQANFKKFIGDITGKNLKHEQARLNRVRDVGDRQLERHLYEGERNMDKAYKAEERNANRLMDGVNRVDQAERDMIKAKRVAVGTPIALGAGVGALGAASSALKDNSEFKEMQRRVEEVNKQAAELVEAMDKLARFNPKKFIGDVTGKNLKYEQARLDRIEDVKARQHNRFMDMAENAPLDQEIDFNAAYKRTTRNSNRTQHALDRIDNAQADMEKARQTAKKVAIGTGTGLVGAGIVGAGLSGISKNQEKQASWYTPDGKPISQGMDDEFDRLKSEEDLVRVPFEEKMEEYRNKRDSEITTPMMSGLVAGGLAGAGLGAAIGRKHPATKFGGALLGGAHGAVAGTLGGGIVGMKLFNKRNPELHKEVGERWNPYYDAENKLREYAEGKGYIHEDNWGNEI